MELEEECGYMHEPRDEAVDYPHGTVRSIGVHFGELMHNTYTNDRRYQWE